MHHLTPLREPQRLAALSVTLLLALPLSATATLPNSRVNDPTGEVGASTTQSSTTLAYSEDTGTLCSAFTDYAELVNPAGSRGKTGFARSTNQAASWTDLGPVGAQSAGSPSLVWHRASSTFVLATLDTSGGGIAIWRSADDCRSWQQIAAPAGSFEDRPTLAVDNHPTSPHFGQLYLAWLDWGSGGTIRFQTSNDGGNSWGLVSTLSIAGDSVAGPTLSTAPDGTLALGWVRYDSSSTGPITIDLVISTDGGSSFSPATSPLVGALRPFDALATASCLQAALPGNVRVDAAPRLAYDASNRLHVVYARDPDGPGPNDLGDIFHRRSLDHGTSWSSETRVNDDTGVQDQFQPTLHTRGNTVVASWYDRRHGSWGWRKDTYARVSTDGGASWLPNQRVSDFSTELAVDPGTPLCYQGDYDHGVTTPYFTILQWSDARRWDGSRWDANVYTQRLPIARSGMTWSLIGHEALFGVDRVGCTGCNAYLGDTSCGSSRRLLCLQPTGAPNPGVPIGPYNGWAGGAIGLTRAITGSLLESRAFADQQCVDAFGPGWRMAEHHDGGGAGWNWQAFGDLSTAPEERFWVAIDDQPANCWD